MVWILPTLNRPKQCAAVLDRVRRTGADSARVVFVNGAENHDAYREEFFNSNGLFTEEVHYHDVNLGALGALNWCFENYPNEKFYGFIGDDEFLMPGTPDNWDRRLIEAAGDWDFSHGMDSIHNGLRAQGYLCIGGELARAVGYLAIPGCWHWFGLDDLWESLAATKICRNVLVPEVMIEHRHYCNDAKRKDACYELGESRREVDQQEFYAWQRYKMKDVVEGIRKAKNA